MVSRIHKGLIAMGAVAALGAAMVVPSAASASVSGGFCSVWLSSGASCHSPYLHSGISELDAASTTNLATCVGVDSTPGGTGAGNVTRTNRCSGASITCLSGCLGGTFTGYAFIHDHSAYADQFSGWIVAAS